MDARVTTFCEAARLAADANLSGRSPHVVIALVDGSFRVAPDGATMQPREAIVWASRWGGSFPVQCTALGPTPTPTIYVWLPWLVVGGSLLVAGGAAYLLLRD